MASLEDVKTINNGTKYCIYGYVRRAQNTLPSDDSVYYTIPELVIYWILLYYFVREEFDEKNMSEYYKISDDNKIVTRVKLGAGAVYLKAIARRGIHRWKFKLRHCNTQNYYFVIGVWKMHHPLEIDVNMYSYHISSYFHGWIVNYSKGTGGELTRFTYGKRNCRTDDIIEMTLDLDDRSLAYNVNDESFGIAHKNIEQTEYKAVISTNWTEDSIEFISYQNFG